MTAPPPIITPEQARQFVADAQAAFAAAIGEGMARIVDEIQRRNDEGPAPTAGPPTSSPATMMHPDRSAVTVASSPQPVDNSGDNVGSSCANPVGEVWTPEQLFTAPPAPCGQPASYPRSSPGSPQRTVDEATDRIASNGATDAPPSSQHPQKTEPPTTTRASFVNIDR